LVIAYSRISKDHICLSLVQPNAMSKTMEDLPNGHSFYCKNCDEFIGAGRPSLKPKWEEARNHIQSNPSHEVHDIFTDKHWYEHADDFTYLLAGAIEWENELMTIKRTRSSEISETGLYDIHICEKRIVVIHRYAASVPTPSEHYGIEELNDAEYKRRIWMESIPDNEDMTLDSKLSWLSREDVKSIGIPYGDVERILLKKAETNVLIILSRKREWRFLLADEEVIELGRLLMGVKALVSKLELSS
jgi:hypothetical protein